MKAKLWLSIVVVSLFLVTLVGCKKADDEEAVEVKSQAEYKTQADKEITGSNMEAELGKIEAEMNAEAEN